MTTEIAAANVAAELLRRKYTVSRDGSRMTIGLGKVTSILRVEVIEEDLALSTDELTDNVMSEFRRYLTELDEEERRILLERASRAEPPSHAGNDLVVVADEPDIEVVTTVDMILGRFVEARSEALQGGRK